jgi:threonine/homoserine/homoserine lactone efflux protein
MFQEAASSFAAGCLLGLTAGLSPGPLTALVIGETVSGGLRDGLKVSAAPLITDAPIVLASALVLAGLPSRDTVIGLVSLAGALFLLHLARATYRAPEAPVEAKSDKNALKRGVIVNFLNPHPYLFWVTVGAPILVAGHAESGAASPAGFLAGFYLCLVGAKAGFAVAADRSRKFLGGRAYAWIMRLLALALLVFALAFFGKGLSLLGLF